MSIFDSMMRDGGVPAMMSSLGEASVAEITAGSIEPFKVDAILGRIRAESKFNDIGAEIKVEVGTLRVRQQDLAAKGIVSIPVTAKIVINDTAWSVRAAESEWGTVWVKLGIEREVRIREWQARRGTV